MVSYMKKMIWGDPVQAAASSGAGEESKDEDGPSTTAANYAGNITQS